ncbi:hypothetical protein F2981_33250 (plasmid) [Sinorhizobium meliloti]|nr:hypothetical protein [Sinorhizobium meliloti]
MASNAAAKNGFVLLSPCRYASGIMVAALKRRPNVEFEPALGTGRATRTGSALDTEKKKENCMDV